MSLSRIPAQIPFELGNQQDLPVIMPYGITSLTPLNRLPFTLSAYPEDSDVPYGSVGWEIVCRSYHDFQTVLFRTSDMAPPTFSKELSSTGLASVSFDLDHYLFNRRLVNGRPVEDLFDYENLWEIYFDKKLRFQFLGTAVRETPVDASEIRTASVSGPGIGQVLNWASVFPKNFPNITKKLETLRDDFNTDAIDTRIWNLTSATQGGVEVSRSGQKEDALREIEVLTDERAGLLQDKTNADADLVSAKNNYNAVYKDKNSTSSEKKAASKELSEATAAKKKIDDAIAAVNVKLANANLKSSLAPNLLEDDTAARAKLTLSSSGQTKVLSAGTFDFVSSGISARIEPLPQGAGFGQARTTFGIQYDHTSYAWFYTANIGGARRLVAEVSDSSSVTADDFAYNPNTNAWWRIREDHGAIIFETSANSTAWTEHLRVENVSWVELPINVVFRASQEGNSGVNPPVSAYLSNVNTVILPAVESVMANFLEHLTAAQKRGTIPYVVPEFTELVDSAGATWVGKPNVEYSEGITLLQLLKNFGQLQQFDWIMDVNFRLKTYQRVWNADESDPTVQFHKEDKIVLHEGNAQLQREHSRDRGSVGNVIVGKNSSGQYAYMEDAESIEKYQRRELFIEAGNATDLSALNTVLQSSLAQVAEEKSSWKISVNPDLPGKRVFEDYDVGDWIAIEMVNSLGDVKKNVWRVIGIAIQVNAEGLTTAELTLQSRMELLAERLQQQVASMGSSASSAGVSIGSSVTAATLLEQAKLANLLDVAMPPAMNRLPGDVLTWTGSYFTLTTPGDKTVPAAPEITEVVSNVYYPETGTTTRAQVQVSWTTPLNTDGSTITDGHHYELRFRPDTTLPYSATWEEASQHLWNELYSWAQPTVPPIDNTNWQIIFVGFDENTTILQELSPGVRYEFQVRAVDSSTPQHWSDWSDSYLHEAAEDTIPPAQPAAPYVASSRLAIQVTHYLGKADGGQFNLPPDLSHLEVHVGGPSFFPSEETYVGKIVANASILRGRTPVIQTFQVESTEDIWVRVIAVDRTGNRSTPSAASTTQVNLIDDAHISDLTASKITAGTLSSAIILSGIIKTAENGPRAEMNFEGFRIFGEEDEAAVSLLSTPGPSGNYLMIKDPNDLSATLAGIDGTGRGSFQSLNIASDITVGGEELLDDIVNPRPKGIIAWGSYDQPYVSGGQNVERGFMELSFIAEEGRLYRITAVTEFESSAANERMIMRFRDFGTADPTLPYSPWIQQSISPALGVGTNSSAMLDYVGTFTPGQHRILWSFYGQAGLVTLKPGNEGGGFAYPLFWIEDVGMATDQTAVINDAGIREYQSGTDPLPGSPGSKVTYTKNYYATWSGSYRSNGDYSSSHGVTMVQGNSGDGYMGDARSLCGFDYNQIMRDTNGSTIKECYITLYANHWWWNDGGTARIGTHNYTGRPGSWSTSRVVEQRITSSNWPKPGKRRVSLGTTIGNEFKSGASKGIALGPTNGDKRQYGRFNGNGQSNEPMLTIVYVK